MKTNKVNSVTRELDLNSIILTHIYIPTYQVDQPVWNNPMIWIYDAVSMHFCESSISFIRRLSMLPAMYVYVSYSSEKQITLWRVLIKVKLDKWWDYLDSATSLNDNADL